MTQRHAALRHVCGLRPATGRARRSPPAGATTISSALAPTPTPADPAAAPGRECARCRTPHPSDFSTARAPIVDGLSRVVAVERRVVQHLQRDDRCAVLQRQSRPRPLPPALWPPTHSRVPSSPVPLRRPSTRCRRSVGARESDGAVPARDRVHHHDTCVRGQVPAPWSSCSGCPTTNPPPWTLTYTGGRDPTVGGRRCGDRAVPGMVAAKCGRGSRQAHRRLRGRVDCPGEREPRRRRPRGAKRHGRLHWSVRRR
jgi:hypothetical protein